jgi:hypothetical protein
MPRRSSFVSLLKAIAREQTRAQRRAEAERRRQERERLLAIRAAERSTALAAKEARQRYLEQRAQEAEEMNLQLSQRVACCGIQIRQVEGSARGKGVQTG